MINKLLLICLLFSFIQLSAQESEIVIGSKYKIESEVLDESRYYTIYLPPSYFHNSRVRYPVVYLMDGDYNFRHTSGLIEQLSAISEKIPEMIVVGISDKGHAGYVKNCTPFDKDNNPTGNSNSFLKFILSELKPHIHQNFKSSSYDMLIGHSLGGLFTVNALLRSPESFDAYIAISPSLWWNDYAAEKKVTEFFESHERINKFLYLSLGDEEGMGVLGFYNQLDVQTFSDKYYNNTPLGLNYEFKSFPNENHNSAGLITVKNALEHLYENYYLSRETLNDIVEFKDYEFYMEPYSKMNGDGFRLPPGQFNKVVEQLLNHNPDVLPELETVITEKYPASLPELYFALGKFYIKRGEKHRGMNYLESSCKLNPLSLEHIKGLADIYAEAGKHDKAQALYTTAINQADVQKTRAWYKNELQSKLENQ